MDTNQESRGMRVLLEIAQDITDALIAEAVNPELARAVALLAADQVRQRHGGEQLYIGKGQALLINKRDLEIWHKHDGSNHHSLAKEYDLTVRQVYNVIARLREEEFNRRQLGLFGEVQ